MGCRSVRCSSGSSQMSRGVLIFGSISMLTRLSDLDVSSKGRGSEKAAKQRPSSFLERTCLELHLIIYILTSRL